MGKAGYYLIRSITWLFQIFPLRVHYLFSDFLFFLAYYIFRYRRDVVATNLANSFPEKTQKERNQIAKDFYKHLCDTFIETFYFDRISLAELQKRMHFLNAEFTNTYLDQGRQIIVFLGHYNNWEWFTTWSLNTPHPFYSVYKKLKSDTFERFYYNLRSRFGCIPLERADTFREVIGNHKKGISSVTCFVFDQTPRVHDIQHWQKFLNQETPWVLGAEKIAQKLDAVVLFLNSHKVKRGYYECEPVVITEHSAACPKYEITNKCVALLEQQIKEHPENWLWSHKRWKHQRSEIEKNKELN